MGCHSHSAAGLLIGTSILAAAGLLGLLGCIRLVEKKERRAIQKRAIGAEAKEKTAVIENKGAVAGKQGVNEVVTTASGGTKVEEVQASSDGTVVVPTAGGKSDVAVKEGEAVVVTEDPSDPTVVQTAASAE